MFLLLFGTAMIYFLLGEPRDGLIMIGFVVIRNSELYTIDSRDLTVGDLVLLEEGDKIPW